MTGIVIFGGTSEGRELAEFCNRKQISAAVSVVSDYGRKLLPESPFLTVRSGAMGMAEMEKWLSELSPCMVVDATHPYAAAVTESVKQVCGRLELPLMRVIRKEGAVRHGNSRVVQVETVAQAVDFLQEQKGNILVTTGSKELKEFTRLRDYQERVFARVLPFSRVIEACESMGIPGNRILALQGPFSVEMNQAMIRHANASWLVTKEAGTAGGFEEKLEAAERTGTGIIIIGRPVREEGEELEEAKKKILEVMKQDSGKLSCRVVLAGTGMGTAGTMTEDVLQAIEESQVLFGASRILEHIGEIMEESGRPLSGQSLVASYLPGPVLQWLSENPGCTQAAVLFSGDSGFYSGAAGMYRALKSYEDLEIKILPGISSLSYLAAAIGKNWEQAVIASRHGKTCDVRSLVGSCRDIFLLTGGADRAETICRELEGLPVTITVGERLSYPDERIVTGKPEELAGETFDSLSVMWIEREDRQ